jgi:hypothetical protein
MLCEARTQLLNELSRAVTAYNQAVGQLNTLDGSLPFLLREELRQVRAECHACRVALHQHEREHGCSLVLAAL